MKKTKYNIPIITKTIWTIILSTLLVGNIFGQEREPGIYSKEEIIEIKGKLKQATNHILKARITVELSTAYRLAVENDSCKKYASIAIALTGEIPPLSKKLNNTNELKMLKAKSIENFGTALSYENTQQAIDTILVALRLWTETGDKPGIAMVNYSLGNTYNFRGEHIQSINYYNKSLKLFIETNNKKYVAYTWYNIGLEQRYLGKYGDALESTYKSLQIARNIKDTTLITNALLGNSFNYMLSSKYTEALREQEEALLLYRLTNDSTGIARVYNDMGVTDMFADKLDEALKNHQIALNIRKKLQDATDTGISYSYIATILNRQGKPKQALGYIKEGVNYAILADDSRFIIDSYLDAGDIYLELKDYKNAKASYQAALKISEKNNDFSKQAIALTLIGKTQRKSGNTLTAITSIKKAEKIVPLNDFKVRRLIYIELKEVYASNNNYKNAYQSQAKFKQMNDSVVAMEKSEKITALTQKLIYENKKALQKASQDKKLTIQESQIKRQKLMRNISIGSLLVVISIAVAFFIRFKEKRKLNIALEKSLNDLKTTQKQLIQSEKMASLGELTAGIAHEIQNPLNFVNNFSEVNKELLAEMLEELGNQNINEVKNLINYITENEVKINHHGQRASSIIKGMLDHSRTSNSVKEPTDINVLVDEYLRLAYHGLRAKDKSFNAVFETDLDTNILKTEVVPQDFGRVILNLINNAFYAASKKAKTATNNYKPTVIVSTKQLHNAIEITVKDNGDGIPKEVKEKIFQPFFTTKPTGEGTGLGLSLAYDIITKGHGGTLKVTSKKNTFTQFTIVIPINHTI